MMASRKITDRAHRYRAQNIVPPGPKVCALCGSRRNITVDHIDGYPDHTTGKNLRYLCKSCNTKKGAAFAKLGKGRLTNQYNPASGVPTFAQYSWAVANHSRGAHDEAGAIIHATPRNKRVEYAKRIAGVKRERGTDSSLPDWARNPSIRDTKKRRPKSGVYGWKPGLDAQGRGPLGPSGTQKVKRTKAQRQGRSNPASASAEAFEDFHGFEPSEVITVTKKVHFHKHLAAAGELVSLDVWGIDNQGHRITGFKRALLAFNEQRNQLFIEGGDQSIDLRDFGIRQPHELETLGKLTDIGYQTNKTHLGDEGGEAVYVHKFRSINDNGKHVIVKIARYPDLVYDVRNEQLLFSGGSYEILREGINK